MSRLAFIGLGVMGGPMASHLARAGHEVRVWNRTAAKMEPVAETGATPCSTIAEAVKGCEGVFFCVSRSEDVQECLSAALGSLDADALLIDHSTISVQAAKNMASQCSQAGHEFLDAPITGGSMGAQNGTLTVFVGGSESAFETAKPWMMSYSRVVERVGESGQGQMTKLANQIGVAGALLALCESLAFAKRAGLDVATTRKLLSTGAAGSWAFENYGPKILDEDWSPGFSIDNQQKDLVYCLEAAKGLGIQLPGTELVHELLSHLQAEGRGAQTTAALWDLLAR